MQKTVSILLITFSSIFCIASVNAALLPVAVTASPTYPIAVSTSATTAPFTYQLKNNAPITFYPKLLSYTASSGSVQEVSGGTCASGVTKGNTCTINLTYTAPASTPSTNPATTSIVFGYGGRSNIPVQTGTFTVGSGSPPSGLSLSLTRGSVKGGQSVTITGTNLTALLLKSKNKDANMPQSRLGANPTVTFDGQAATIVGMPTSTSIVVTTPDDTTNYAVPAVSCSAPTTPPTVQPGFCSGSSGGAGRSVNVVVTTAAGSATLTNGYTYVGLGDNYSSGIIYQLNGSADAGGKVVNNSDGSAVLWAVANTTCTSMGSGWGLPDPYAGGATPVSGAYVTGDFQVLCNNGSSPSSCPNAYAGMTTTAYWGLTDQSNTSNAWGALFVNGFEVSLGKTFSSDYERCVRPFTA